MPALENSYHVAIIMDGNGRWAKQRGLPRAAGHRKGAESLRSIITECPNMGITHLTLYAFSAENWRRPNEEVSDLMQLLALYLKKEINLLIKNDICLRVIGERERLPKDICKLVQEAELKTVHGQKLYLTIALSYGARQEIVHAMQKIAMQLASEELNEQDITEEIISKNLFTHDLPDPDLLIRTGGEQRLSNFLLWQSAYSELYFTEVLWPDFTPAHLQIACDEFAGRERRFGGV